MTPAQKRFVDLEKKKDEVKKFYDELKSATEDLAKEIGVGGLFQDHEGTVYKVIIPDGKFVTFDKIGYKRTRRIHEKSGDLSIKEATAAGFLVPDKL
jgi:hypothetical protein